MIHLLNLLYLSSAAFLFLEETLYKTMKQAAATTNQNGHRPVAHSDSDDSDEDTESLTSRDTTVEMLTLGSETEQEELTNGIAESDLDTQSDGGSMVNTDTELLINDGDYDGERQKKYSLGVQVRNHSRTYFKKLWTKLTLVDPAALCRHCLVRQKEQCQLCLCCGEVGSTRSRRGCLEMVRQCSWRKVWQQW